MSLPGSARFRKTIRAYIPIYLAASSTMDEYRPLLIELLTRRFLKCQSRNREWIVMGQDQIRDTVGHALRKAIYDMERESTIKSVISPKTTMVR